AFRTWSATTWRRLPIFECDDLPSPSGLGVRRPGVAFRFGVRRPGVAFRFGVRRPGVAFRFGVRRPGVAFRPWSATTWRRLPVGLNAFRSLRIADILGYTQLP